MASDNDSLGIPAPVLRSLRAALRSATAAETAPEVARELLALCDTVLLRIECGGGAAPAPADRAVLAELTQHCRSLESSDNAARAAAISRLRVLIEHEARRLEEGEAAVARAAAMPAASATQISADAVRAYLRRRFPAATFELRGCRELPGGRSKITVMLELTHVGAGADAAKLPREVVLRCDRPESAQGTTVVDEFPVLEAMHRARAFAPEPLWLEPDPAGLGVAFLAMRRMPGSACGDYWRVGSATAAHARALAQALARIHGVDPRAAWPAAAATARETMAELLTENEKTWRALSFPSVALGSGYAWLRAQLHTLTGPSVTVHGDVHFGNVLFQGEHISCLTDWEFAHAGHPAEDLAFCRRHIESLLPWPEFLAAYTAACGCGVANAELRFFNVWTSLRNATLGASALQGVLAGGVPDIRIVAIALHARVRLESSLARVLATELAAAETSATPGAG